MWLSCGYQGIPFFFLSVNIMLVFGCMFRLMECSPNVGHVEPFGERCRLWY